MADGSSKAALGGLRLAKVLVWLVYAYFIVAVIVLVLAFFLLLFAASTDADFTQWVYRAADRALAPFWGIFPSVEGESGSVLDFAVVFAIIMYGILALLVHALVEWLDTKIFEAKRRRALAEAPPTYAPYVQGAPAPVSAPPPAPPAATTGAGHWTGQQTTGGAQAQPVSAAASAPTPSATETAAAPSPPPAGDAKAGDAKAGSAEAESAE
jgi:uncharacterized protein YggT (Ycf19 family)